MPGIPDVVEREAQLLAMPAIVERFDQRQPVLETGDLALHLSVAGQAARSMASRGGWQMIVAGGYGVDGAADPSSGIISADGNSPANGWANNLQIEAEIAAWYDATSLDEEKTIGRRLNRLAVEHVLYAQLGVHLQHHAWRKNVSGIVQARLPLSGGSTRRRNLRWTCTSNPPRRSPG
jgi:hypothetical protein